MLRAVVPLVRAGRPVVFELIADCFPGLPAVIGALDDLAEPTAGLRRVDAVWLGGRAFEVINFPTRKMRAADIPLLALAIGSQNERAFFCADQYSYFTHGRQIEELAARTGQVIPSSYTIGRMT